MEDGCTSAGGKVCAAPRSRSQGEGAGRERLLDSGMETHLDGRIMGKPRRIRRTLVNILPETGATTCAEVAAHGLAAPSVEWMVMLGSNFHSSHSPRLGPASWAPWKSPTTCSLRQQGVEGGGLRGLQEEEEKGGGRSPVA